MALTWTDPIIFYPIPTRPKHFVINPKLPVFGLQQNCEYDQKWTNNILKYANQCPCCIYSGWGWEAWFLFNSTLFSKFLEKIYDTLVRNTPTRPGPKSLSPTWPNPKIFSKTFPDPELVSVQSSPVQGNSGFWVAPQVSTQHTQFLVDHLSQLLSAVDSTIRISSTLWV